MLFAPWKLKNPQLKSIALKTASAQKSALTLSIVLESNPTRQRLEHAKHVGNNIPIAIQGIGPSASVPHVNQVRMLQEGTLDLRVIPTMRKENKGLPPKKIKIIT